MAKNRNFTEKEKENIANDYSSGKFSCPKLGLKYGVSKTTIFRILKNKNIKINNDASELSRKYELKNRDFFEVIDSEEKAYFLGLMFSDGCNHEQNNSFSISLQEKDRHILESFNTYLGSTRPLQIIKLNDKNRNWQNSCRLTVSSAKMCDDLTSLGCIFKKSLLLKFPSDGVPDDLLRHFIRGYMDGDGSFCLYKNKKTERWSYGGSLVSNLDFCITLKEIIKNKVGINSCLYKKPSSENSTRILYVNGVKTLNKFLAWLYEDSTIFLKRKKDAFIKNKEFLSSLNKL